MSEEKKSKPFYKKRRFYVIAFIFVCSLFNRLSNDWSSTTSSTSVQQQQSTQSEQKTQTEQTDVVQERMNHFIETRSEVPEFEKIERLDTNSLWIYFTKVPDLWIDDPIDQTTRGQARNLSIDVDGVASVKTFVWWIPQMFCVATKGQVNDCSDYR